MNKFAERLKELREDKGLSQAKLAKEVNMTQAAIGLWELGKRVPNLDAVIILANYFNVSLEYIAGLEN